MLHRPHYNLEAWKQGMHLAKLIYKWSEIFPTQEKFGLLSQIRRAAVSVPSNIAEGAARNSTKEFAYFINVSRGSLSEIETQYLLAINLDMAQSSEEIETCMELTAKLLTGLYKSQK